MLIKFVIVVSLGILIYWAAPKIETDPKLVIKKNTQLKFSSTFKRISWDNSSRLFVGDFAGPESFTHDPVTGAIYTGAADGKLYILDINDISTTLKSFVRIMENNLNCESNEFGKACGRILGLKYVDKDKLIVADAYNGIYAIHLGMDMATKQVLVSPDKDMLTRSLKFFNSLDVSKNGIIYFTVSSMKWTLDDSLYAFLEGDSSGRVYSYDLVTRKLHLIAANLSFPNGLSLTQNQTSLVVAELTKGRLLKINLLKSQDNVEVFVDGLLGTVDNVKRDNQDNFYVALPTEDSYLLSFIHRYPLINYYVAWLIPKRFFNIFLKSKSRILKINNEGEIILEISGNKVGMDFITEAYETNGKILLGNLFNPYLDVLYLNH